MSEAKYHSPTSCKKCGGKNETKVTQTDDGYASEIKTLCTECDHADVWAYGFFESSDSVVSKCQTYVNRGKE